MYYYWNIYDVGNFKLFNLKIFLFLYVNICIGIFSRLVLVFLKFKMFVIYYVNRKKIIFNMCKICVEIINILWVFFFIVERVRIIFKYKYICSINNYFNFNL